MIKLYLIRHGETDWNKEMRFQGWTNIELNSTGLKQAKKLGKRFENIEIDEIYASPLKRAVDTAIPIAQATGVPIYLNEDFKEINFGDWEGMTAKEISQKFGKEFDDFIARPDDGYFPGEISFENVTKRLKKGLDEVLTGKEDKNIVIVSHGGIVRLIIKYLMEFEGEWYNKTWIDNTSITVIQIRERGNLLRVLNDSSHLNHGTI